jgi:hypothetical protein
MVASTYGMLLPLEPASSRCGTSDTHVANLVCLTACPAICLLQFERFCRPYYMAGFNAPELVQIAMISRRGGLTQGGPSMLDGECECYAMMRAPC